MNKTESKNFQEFFLIKHFLRNCQTSPPHSKTNRSGYHGLLDEYHHCRGLPAREILGQPRAKEY